MNNLANLASKKFGIMLGVIGSLLALAIQIPEKSMECMYLSCGMSIIYCLFEIVDKIVESKFPKPKDAETK